MQSPWVMRTGYTGHHKASSPSHGTNRPSACTTGSCANRTPRVGSLPHLCHQPLRAQDVPLPSDRRPMTDPAV